MQEIFLGSARLGSAQRSKRFQTEPSRSAPRLRTPPRDKPPQNLQTNQRNQLSVSQKPVYPLIISGNLTIKAFHRRVNVVNSVFRKAESFFTLLLVDNFSFCSNSGGDDLAPSAAAAVEFILPTLHHKETRFKPSNVLETMQSSYL
ncbi:hypothetical protein AMECASPLE_010966 [Ameca splendens]|uniref:Uncharacterized protein n=1 Tax=Ameca splendens TaxID=208324 RepID=A0ABV0XPR4_9TELE